MDFTVNGLPLHPLLVHAVIALVPLTSLAVVLHALWPAARRRLGVLTPLAGVALVIAVPITVAAGQDLQGRLGPIPSVQRHAALGDQLLPWAIGLLVVGVLEWAWYRWRDRIRMRPLAAVVVTALIGLAALGTAAGALGMLVLIGDSGARAVWGG
jgi:RsiW-degrading membrane proteinase PrsW (M82 family)